MILINRWCMQGYILTAIYTGVEINFERMIYVLLDMMFCSSNLLDEFQKDELMMGSAEDGFMASPPYPGSTLGQYDSDY